MVLVEVSGISEEMHGLTITVAEDGHSFTISGLPTLEPLRNGGTATAESTFELTLCYKYKGIFLPEDRPVLERKIPFVINQDPRKLWKIYLWIGSICLNHSIRMKMYNVNM